MEEISAVIRKMKNNKSPGPDTIPVEFFKWMDDNSVSVVLNIINKCWELEIMPEELEKANVVTLYKKGSVEDPANYRPISLLNSLYKIYASLIQVRLANSVDDRISDKQFGFRRKKSTNQPLFIARRIQDMAEAAGDKLFIVFLDWEKAFDRIDQKLLIRALERLNIPEK